MNGSSQYAMLSSSEEPIGNFIINMPMMKINLKLMRDWQHYIYHVMHKFTGRI